MDVHALIAQLTEMRQDIVNALEIAADALDAPDEFGNPSPDLLPAVAAKAERFRELAQLFASAPY